MRENPALKLVVLAKHGLVVWGDTAEEAYRRTIEVINQAVEFVNARTAGRARFGGAGSTPADVRPRRRAARASCRRCAARSRSERRKLLVVDTSPRVLEFVASRDAGALTDVGAACPDHLVHTKRVPLWIPFDPAADDARRARASASASAPPPTATSTARTSSATPTTTTEPGDPDARVVLIQHVGLVGVGDDDQGRAACRATSTTARSR